MSFGLDWKCGEKKAKNGQYARGKRWRMGVFVGAGKERKKERKKER